MERFRDCVRSILPRLGFDQIRRGTYLLEWLLLTNNPLKLMLPLFVPWVWFFPTKSGLTSRMYLPLYRFARAHQSLFRIIWPQVGIVWTLNPNILVSFALRDLCKGGWSTNQQRPLQPPCPTCLWPNYLTTPAYLLATHLLLKSSWVKLDATSSSRILIPEFFPELLNSISSWS